MKNISKTTKKYMKKLNKENQVYIKNNADFYGCKYNISFAVREMLRKQREQK